MNRLVGNVISSIAESRPLETVTSLLYVHMRVWVPGCNVNSGLSSRRLRTRTQFGPHRCRIPKSYPGSESTPCEAAIDPSVATTKEIEDTELSLIDPDLSDLVRSLTPVERTMGHQCRDPIGMLSSGLGPQIHLSGSCSRLVCMSRLPSHLHLCLPGLDV